MGYWEEKQKYREELEERKFCNICGKKLTAKNIKGRCINCEEVICNSCGTINRGKVICIDCKKAEKEGTQSKSIKFPITTSISPFAKKCSWCGGTTDYNLINCQGNHGLFQRKGKFLCENCAERCNKCKKCFCSAHLKDHKCI